MYIIYGIKSLIVMQGYFKKKIQNAPRPSEHPPVVAGGGTNTEYAGSLGYNSVFRVCYITSSIDVDVIHCCFVLLINRSGLNHTQRGCQSGTRGLLDRKRSEEHLQ